MEANYFSEWKQSTMKIDENLVAFNIDCEDPPQPHAYENGIQFDTNLISFINEKSTINLISIQNKNKHSNLERPIKSSMPERDNIKIE